MMTDAQKTKRYELENKQGQLTLGERFLLAALNDLKEADKSGENIDACEVAAKAAEKLYKKEANGEDVEVEDVKEIPAGGADVRRLLLNV